LILSELELNELDELMNCLAFDKFLNSKDSSSDKILIQTN